MKTITVRQWLIAAFAVVCAVILVLLFVNWVNSPSPVTQGEGSGQQVVSSTQSAKPQKPTAASSASASPSSKATQQVPKEKFGLPVIRESELPREGRETLKLIRNGGPYPYSRDGVNFGNFEGILPKKRGGFYAEYTVPTPGEDDRGARRIVVGDDGTKFYTDDHYESFFYIQEGA